MNARSVSQAVWGVLLVVGPLLVSGGCGDADSSCRVSGQVTINHKPAAGVYVLLQMETDSTEQPASRTVASARTGDDGTFALVVPSAGQYAVNAFWPEVIKTPDEVVEGEDRFRGRYLDPKRPITTVEITDPQQTLPAIELTFRKYTGRAMPRWCLGPPARFSRPP